MSDTVPEGWTTQILNGMGAYLAANGVGSWNPAGVYAEDQIGITVDAVPQTPTRLITLTCYPVEDLPGIADVQVAIQVRTRGDALNPRVRNDIADACYGLLHGLQRVTWGGVAVLHVYRQSWAPIGQDASRRYERADNYYADAMRPNALNPD